MKMDTPKSIIIAAIIIAVSISITSGIYEFSSVQLDIVQRYNKFTGDVAICVVGHECKSFSKMQSFSK